MNPFKCMFLFMKPEPHWKLCWWCRMLKNAESSRSCVWLQPLNSLEGDKEANSKERNEREWGTDQFFRLSRASTDAPTSNVIPCLWGGVLVMLCASHQPSKKQQSINQLNSFIYRFKLIYCYATHFGTHKHIHMYQDTKTYACHHIYIKTWIVK